MGPHQSPITSLNFAVQNVTDVASSKAFMILAATFPARTRSSGDGLSSALCFEGCWNDCNPLNGRSVLMLLLEVQAS